MGRRLEAVKAARAEPVQDAGRNPVAFVVAENDLVLGADGQPVRIAQAGGEDLEAAR